MDCDQIFMDVFRNLNVSEKLNVFRLVQLPFVSVGSAWRYGGLTVLCPLMSGTWASADLEIFTKRRGSAANPPGIPGDDCEECSGFFFPFPTYLSSAIFLPSLAPTASPKAHSTCPGPYCSDDVKEQSRQ